MYSVHKKQFVYIRCSELNGIVYVSVGHSVCYIMNNDKSRSSRKHYNSSWKTVVDAYIAQYSEAFEMSTFKNTVCVILFTPQSLHYLYDRDHIRRAAHVQSAARFHEIVTVIGAVFGSPCKQRNNNIILYAGIRT